MFTYETFVLKNYVWKEDKGQRLVAWETLLWQQLTWQ